MLRISKLTDYAIVLATELANGPAARSVRTLAADTGIPAATVSKILKDLRRAGLIAATRGARGGYRLARAPEAVSLSDVIAAVEGPVALTQCAGRGACELERTCGVRGNWQRISDAVRAALSGITLTQMARPLDVVPLRRGATS